MSITRVIRTWSCYQQAIFDEIANGTGNCHVEAIAGSGKTTSIIEGFYHMKPGLTALMVAFSKPIQLELEARAPSHVQTKTLHAVGLAACKKAFPHLQKFNSIDSKKEKLYQHIKALGFLDSEELTMIAQTVGLAKGYLAETINDIDIIIDKHDINVLPENRDKFINYVLKVLETTKKDTSRIDFDDMIWYPIVHNLQLIQYDYVFVDETQDLNNCQISMVLRSIKPNGRILTVGDSAQCVDIYTIMAIENGTTKTAGELKEGDRISSFRNGKNEFQTVSKVVKSSKTNGIKVTTSDGNFITMTKDHQLWATLPVFSEKEEHLVYLMYRPKFGYRVGVTNKGYSRNKSEKNISSRLNSENAERMWILDWTKSKEEALLKELSYSLKYGIPTCVFKGEERGLNQNHINAIFNMFGHNGENLLKDKDMSFDLPHWMSASATGVLKTNSRTNISFIEHSHKGSQVCLEWTESVANFCKILIDNNIAFTKAKGNNRFRIRKYFYSNKSAFEFAHLLSGLLNCTIVRRLSMADNKLSLMTAGSLHIGMKIPVKNDIGFDLKEIVSIEEISDAQFVDIEVDNACNFYGNNILSHNCIFSFRGADHNAINNIITRMNSKVLPLSVSYRCGKNIIREAQKYVPHIEYYDGAIDGLVKDIAPYDVMNMVKPGDFILSRINAPLITWCMNLIAENIPANIKGNDVAKGLLALIKNSKAKDLDGFLTYMQKWADIEIARLTKLNREVGVVTDKLECMYALCEGCSDLMEVKKRIETLFYEGDDNRRVILSTTHKAKGLERDRVFMLNKTYKPEKSIEERNLTYVAITRAKKELYYVN